MDIETLEKELAEIESDAATAIASASSLEQLRAVEARFVGKKGSLSKHLRTVKDYPPDLRGLVGQMVNACKQQITGAARNRKSALERSAADREATQAQDFDPTLPGPVYELGSLHPVTVIQKEIEEVFTRLGFTVEAGPEMESDYYNFEALNIPAWHPARDMQDTFWMDNGMLLRTHTSPVQVHAMEKFGAPLRCIVPGRCFRYETVDASHENTFHQCEGLLIDRNISIANLIAVMRLLLREVFRREVKIRLRPGYFPFVEPGFELDMSCTICNGSGCPTCKKSGWVEILPCGMVHPNVLRYGGIDPHEFTGFAFGLGLTRLAMMKFGIRDIRVLNMGDVRALVHADKLTGPTIIAK